MFETNKIGYCVVEKNFQINFFPEILKQLGYVSFKNLLKKKTRYDSIYKAAWPDISRCKCNH